MATRLRRQPIAVSGCVLSRPDGVVVGGSVVKPGHIRHTIGMTMKQAIDRAGGVDEFASLKRVRLIRGSNMFVLDLNTERGRNVILFKDDLIDVNTRTCFGLGE